MRKLMTLMLGLSLALGAVTVSFAQDKKDETPRRPRKRRARKRAATSRTKSFQASVFFDAAQPFV